MTRHTLAFAVFTARAALCGAVFLGSACGNGPLGAQGEGEGEDEGDPAEVAGASLSATTNTTRSLDGVLFGVVDAVVAASTLVAEQRLVTSGTITIAGQNATYSASPANALVVTGAGDTIRYEIDTFTIDPASDSIADALVLPHSLAFTATVDDSLDLVVSSRSVNGTLTRSATGTVEDEFGTWDVDLEQGGTVAFDIGGGVRHEAVETRTGTLSGDAGDLEFSVSEDYRLVIFDDVVEQRVTEVEVDGELDGLEVEVEDGLLRRVLRNGFAVEADFWEGSRGTVRVGDDVQGEIEFRSTSLVFELVLDVDDGDDVVLETFPR